MPKIIKMDNVMILSKLSSIKYDADQSTTIIPATDKIVRSNDLKNFTMDKFINLKGIINTGKIINTLVAK